MSRRRQSKLSPNLFPFLAVLVCTLGTLMLFLALVAQDAQQSADAATADQTKSARIAAEDHRWQAEQLMEYRATQAEALEQKRGELAHLEDHLRRLRDELAQLQFESHAAAHGSDSESNKKTQAKLVSLKTQIDREKEMIRDLKEERAGRPPRVVIVPYQGTSGTDRRPIYIECTDEAVIIQPEGVRISASQLDGPLGPGNPLDAALRTIRSHWKTLDPDASPPYPLLLVRPNGIYAYGACRMAMASWDDQFGYELIPGDLPLAFPKPDPTLETKLVMAVQEAAARQQGKLAAGRPAVRPRSLDPAGQRQANFSGGGSAGGTATGGTVIGSSAATSFDQIDANADLTGSGTGFGSASGNGLGDGRLGGTAPGGSLGSLAAGNASANQGGGSFRADSGTGESGTADSGTGESGTGDSGLADSGTGESNNDSDSSELASGQLAGSAAGNSGGSVDSSASNPLGGEGGTLGNGQMQGSGTANAASTLPAGQTATAAMASPSSASTLQTPSEPFDPHAKTFSEQATQTPPPGSQSSSKSSTNSSPPVLRSGNNWAMPESTFTARGPTIVRQMRLQCRRDSFVLMPDGKTSLQPQTFAVENGQLEPTALALATVMRDRIATWGVAMQNGRWDPVLVVRVEPGAEGRFGQLQTFLRDSGIRVEQESAQ